MSERKHEIGGSSKCLPGIMHGTDLYDNNVSFLAALDDNNRGNSQEETVGEEENCTEYLDHLHGDHETQVSEGGEADLHKHLIGCKKNPGHINFIPVDTFTINHLPEGHRDKDLYELIKVTADLTVRVVVKMISSHRPEFWPKTKVSYPLYNMRVKTTLRTGSGWVSCVEKYTDGYRKDPDGEAWSRTTTCWCTKCKHSGTPSHVWWEFDVHSATHVVFDDTEAKHTSLKLFYDTEGSQVISIDQVSVEEVNIERDWCLLSCVTCDKNLGEQLNMLWIRYNDVWWNVWNKFYESRDVHKLNFIVSHPHGCCKQVSVGHWVDKFKIGDDLNKFTYTTCTCPGSSGARVHCVGYGGGRCSYQPVHCGSFKSKLNYSGSGDVW